MTISQIIDIAKDKCVAEDRVYDSTKVEVYHDCDDNFCISVKQCAIRVKNGN